MKKGEFGDYELLVEQSDTKNGVTISLWMIYDAFLKTQNVRYEVDSHDPAMIKRNHGYGKLHSFTSGAKAREQYEKYCSENGFLPYP